MSTPSVLIVDARATAAALREVLERRGFDVRTAENVEDALGQPRPDVLVTETELPDGEGHEIAAALRPRRVVFVSNRPTVDSCRRALLLGAADFLTKPFRLEELIRAVESDLPDRSREEAADTTFSRRIDDPTPSAPREVSTQPSQVEGGDAPFERVYTTGSADVERATRELAAHLVGLGAGPSCRARIVSAAGEVFDNARRHAYVGTRGRGTFRVRVAADPRFITVDVTDSGAGFDTAEVAGYAFDSPAHNGLARAACLAEDVGLESRLGEGTTVTLRFSSYRVEFDEEDHIDLTELDYLTPELARRVLEVLSDDSGDDPFRLSPAMAVAVGRLLAGPDPGKRLQLALWS